MRSAYGDESADETKQRVFAVAGLFGSKTDWRNLCEKWHGRTGGKIFHASDCDTNQGDFRHRSNDENKKLYADLANIFGDSSLIGAAVAINLPAYRELLGETLDENPYYLCFLSVIVGLAMDSAVCIPRDSIKCTFDRNQEIEYNAAQLYDHIMRSAVDSDFEWHKYMEDEIGFATQKTIGIQVADLLAREAMKQMDNAYGPVQRPIRSSLLAIRKNNRVRIRLYTRGWCERMVGLVQSDPSGIFTRDEYSAWLQRNGLQGDTLSRRLRYQMECNVGAHKKDED